MKPVSDAPIPAHLLRAGNDVHYPDVCDCDLVGLQAQCTIQPPLESVGDWIKRLIATAIRLEAEKQAAHTEGWNAAIQEAAKAADSVYPEHIKGNPLVSVLTCPGSVLEGAVRLIRVLSKPTAAKPEPSPSSANRAEGRP